MNSRERVLCALDHRQPDRPPRDLGGSLATSLHPTAYRNLQKHLGLSGQIEMLSARSSIVRVSEPILDRFGIDFVPVSPRLHAEPPVLDADNTYVDRWGVQWRFPGDGGHFYVTRSPLAEAARPSDLDAHPWLEPETDFSELTSQARALNETSDRALVLNLGVGFIHLSQFLRGFDLWLMDLVSDPSLAQAIMDRVLEIYLVETEATLQAVQPYVDIAFYADDAAIQDRTMFSPRVYRSLIRPRFKRVFDLVKSYDVRLVYHSCGNISALIGDLLDLGIDALNPIQVSAGAMGDTAALKGKWGNRLTFWGGIDTHSVLPSGTPEQVREEVWRRLDDMAQDGGYVLASVHDIQAEVPPENVSAMFDAAEEWSQRNG